MNPRTTRARDVYRCVIDEEGAINTAEKKPQGKVRQADAPDILVANEGTVFVFCPLTSRAKEWIGEHVQQDATWFGHALVVEHRFAWGSAQGMVADSARISRQNRFQRGFFTAKVALLVNLTAIGVMNQEGVDYLGNPSTSQTLQADTTSPNAR